jgi:hypothetical protein
MRVHNSDHIQKYTSPVPKHFSISSSRNHDKAAELRGVGKYLDALYFANKEQCL